MRGKDISLQNIHPHQIEFMGEFEKQGGIAFIILYFTGLDEIYYLPFEQIEDIGNGWRREGAKALPTTRWTRAGGSVPMPVFWSIIWKKYKKTWTEGHRRFCVKRRAFHAACAGPFLVRTSFHILSSNPVFTPSLCVPFSPIFRTTPHTTPQVHFH